MENWKVASRLRLLIAVSIVVMLLLLGINWLSLNHLSDLSVKADRRARDSAQVNASLGLGAQAYRNIADTYINRDFDTVGKDWRNTSNAIDRALTMIEQVADTGAEREWAQGARRAMDELRALYNDSFLPLTKNDAPAEEIRAVDDRIDRLIDQYQGYVERIDQSLKQELTEASGEFASGVVWTKVLNSLSIAIGGALLIAIGVVIARSITGQLGLELSEAMAATRRIAAGDLSDDLLSRQHRPDSLAASLAHMNRTLAGMVLGIRGSSHSVATASAEIAQGNGELSVRTNEQASALEETAASMEELGSTVRHNADNAGSANQLAQQASEVATEGGRIVAQAVATMRSINESSRRIADIIGVIDGIAFQTNILALNAAVEAARSGEQGRGFAVVASEVRSLAGRSAAAAKEIKALIDDSVTRVANGTALVNRAGQTMTDVVSSIQRVTELMHEIHAATSEQASGIRQAGEALAQMDQTTQQNATLVEQSAAAAENLKVQAQLMTELVGQFKLGAVI